MKKFLAMSLFVLLSCLAWGQANCSGNLTLGPCTVSVVGINVTLAPPSIAVNQTSAATAQLQVSGGALNAIINNQCLWTTDTPAVATVSASGLVTGLSAGTANISCTAGTGASQFTGTATISVVAPPIITTPNAATCATPCPLPAATQGTAYSFTFVASGGVLPYTWTNSVGSPPTGLTLSSAGVLSGTPSGTGTTTWTVQVSDNIAETKTLQVSLTVNATAACGTGNPIQNYCARMDTAVSSGASVNSGNPPAALIGLNGAGNCVIDDNNSGPAAEYICRITDFAMTGTGTVTDTSSSTLRQWDDDSSIFSGIYSSNSSAAFFTVADGTPPTTGVKGTAGVDKNGLGMGNNIQWSHNPCTVPLCGTAAATSHEFYSSGSNPSGFPTRQTINNYVLDTTNAAWTGSTGLGQNLSAAITGSVLADPITWQGLTSYMIVQNGPQWNRWLAAQSADTLADANDHIVCMDYRYQQDMGSLVTCFNRSNGAYQWLDTRTGQTCGSAGMPCGATTGFGPMPAPLSPIVTFTSTGGTLDCTKHWIVFLSYTVIGYNTTGGETTLSPGTIISPISGTTTCSMGILAPSSNPGGGSAINGPLTATGYNVYLCQAKIDPDTGLFDLCTGGLPAGPAFLQAPSSAPAQPVISSVTGCTTGTSSNTVTYWAVIRNGSRSTFTGSLTSAPSSLTVTSNAAPGCTVTLTAPVPTGMTADILRDDTSIQVCSIAAGASSCRDNTQNPTPYANQTNVIGSQAVITSFSTTNITAPTVNYAGVPIHNLRVDEAGTSVQMEVADAYQNAQNRAPNMDTQLSWQLGTANLVGWHQNNNNTCPSGGVYAGTTNYAAAHWTNGFSGGTSNTVSWISGSGRTQAIVTPLSNTCSAMNAAQFFMNQANGGLDTQSGDQHLNHSNACSGCSPDTPVFRDAYPTVNPYVLPTVPYDGEITAWMWPVGITSVSRSANVVTVTTTQVHNLQTGANVTLNGVTDSTYNGTASNITVTGNSTFTFSQTGANSTSTGGNVDRPMQRFCHTWDSAKGGVNSGGNNFNSTPRGGVSNDGKWFFFVSDMQRNGNGAQGTAAVGLGSTAGTSTCTTGGAGNCRYDLFVCRLH